MLKIKNHNFDTDLYHNNICIDEIFNKNTKEDAKNKIKLLKKFILIIGQKKKKRILKIYIKF